MSYEYDLIFFALVSMRVTGCIALNPIFGRRNVPTLLKAGFILILTVFVCSSIPVQQIDVSGVIDFAIIAMRELLLGLIVGFIMRMFFSVITVGGEVMDMQMGFSMAKAYDAQSESSISVSASILNIMFMMTFFAANGHITLMKIFLELATIVPYGKLEFNLSSIEQLVSLFSLILIYAVKLSLPIFAIEFITEMGVGLLMKAVPQINVFIINIQFKIFIGLVSIMLLVPAFSAFFERLITLMFDQIHNIVGL